MDRMQDDIAKALKQQRFDLPTAGVKDLAEVLYDLGGSGHRAVVIEAVARRRGASAASPAFQQEICQDFACGCTQRKGRAGKPVLVLPFGAGSLRWALDRDAYGVIRSATMAPRAPSGRRPASPARQMELATF